jgi:hypothetical protein
MRKEESKVADTISGDVGNLRTHLRKTPKAEEKRTLRKEMG